jgi:hypothetical protein
LYMCSRWFTPEFKYTDIMVSGPSVPSALREYRTMPSKLLWSEVRRQSLCWIIPEAKRHCTLLYQVHQCCTKQAPLYLYAKFTWLNYIQTRSAAKLQLGRPKTEFYNSRELQHPAGSHLKQHKKNVI